MNRREFVAGLSRKAAMAGAGVSAAAAATYPKVRDGAQAGFQKLSGEVGALTERIDNMEESHKRAMRVMIMVVSVSTGLDALRLINGDLI